MPAADWLWHGCHDCMDIWWIRRLFGHWADLCFRWFGTVSWLVGLGRLRLPVRLSSRVRTLLSQQMGSLTLIRRMREPAIKGLSGYQNLLGWRSCRWHHGCPATWRSSTTINSGGTMTWRAPLSSCMVVTHVLLLVAACHISLILLFLQGHEAL